MEHQRKWLARLQACEASGKSVSAYASEQGLPVRAMYDAKGTDKLCATRRCVY